MHILAKWARRSESRRVRDITQSAEWLAAVERIRILVEATLTAYGRTPGGDR